MTPRTGTGRLAVLAAVLVIGSLAAVLLFQLTAERGPMDAVKVGDTWTFSTEIDHVRYYPGEDIVTYRTDEGGLANFTATSYAEVTCSDRIISFIGTLVMDELGNDSISGYTESADTITIGIGDPHVTGQQMREAAPEQVTCRGHLADISVTETYDIEVRKPDFTQRRPHLNAADVLRYRDTRLCSDGADTIDVAFSPDRSRLSINGTVDVPYGVEPVRFKTSSLLADDTLRVRIDPVIPRFRHAIGCTIETDDGLRAGDLMGSYNLTYRIPPETTVEDVIVIHDGRQAHPVRLDPNMTRR